MFDNSIRNQLKLHPLFNALPASVFSEVSERSILCSLYANESLFEQDAPATHFFVLLRGQMKLMRQLEEGQEKVIELVTLSGQTLGEAWLFGGCCRYPCRAIAQKRSLLIGIDWVHYHQQLAQAPQLCLQLLSRLGARIEQQRNDMETLTLNSASRRVVRYLVQEQKSSSDSIQLKAPKHLIASQLGIQPETLSRILHRLKDAGLIAMQQSRIRILDRQNLARYQE